MGVFFFNIISFLSFGDVYDNVIGMMDDNGYGVFLIFVDRVEVECNLVVYIGSFMLIK